VVRTRVWSDKSGQELFGNMIYQACRAVLTFPLVLDPGKGVCTDPVGRDATLGVGGPGPPVGAGERQLSPDRGGEKT
jgi:hypothetical protein